MRRGLATTGTLGVLLVAAERALIDAEGIYHQLIAETNFRSTPKLQESFLQRVREMAKRRT
jgi:predicted nucleic acid-binding protein